MLNPKLKKYTDRIRELIDEGMAISKLEKPSQYSEPYIQGEDQIRVQSWHMNVRNIIETTFGRESLQLQQLNKKTDEGKKHLDHDYDIFPIVGILKGGFSDLENGYLEGQEFIIAGVVFDDVLE